MVCLVEIIERLEFTIKSLPPDSVHVAAKTQKPANIISINKNNNPDRASIQLFINIQDTGGGQQPDTVGVYHTHTDTEEKTWRLTCTHTQSHKHSQPRTFFSLLELPYEVPLSSKHQSNN